MIGDLTFLFVRLGDVPSRSYNAITICEIIKNEMKQNKIFSTGHYSAFHLKKIHICSYYTFYLSDIWDVIVRLSNKYKLHW